MSFTFDSSKDLNGNHIFMNHQMPHSQFQQQQLPQAKTFSASHAPTFQNPQQFLTPQEHSQPYFPPQSFYQHTNHSDSVLNDDFYNGVLSQIPDEQIVAGLQEKTDQLKQDGFCFDDSQEPVTIETLLEDDPLLSFTTTLDRQTSNDTILQSSSPIVEPVEPFSYKQMENLTLNSTENLNPRSPRKFQPQIPVQSNNAQFTPTPVNTNTGMTPVPYQYLHNVIQPSNNYINTSHPIPTPLNTPISASSTTPNASQFRAQVQSQTIFQQQRNPPDANFGRPAMAFAQPPLNKTVKTKAAKYTTPSKSKASKVSPKSQQGLKNFNEPQGIVFEHEMKPVNAVYSNQQFAVSEDSFHGPTRPELMKSASINDFDRSSEDTPSKSPLNAQVGETTSINNIKKSSSTTKLNKTKKGSNIILTKSKSFLTTPTVGKSNNTGIYSTLDFSKQVNLTINKDSQGKLLSSQPTILRVQPVKNFEFVFEQGGEKASKVTKPSTSRRPSASATPTSARFPKFPKPPTIDGHGTSFYSPNSTSPTNSDISGTSPLTGSLHQLQNSPVTSSVNRFSPSDSSTSINEIPTISKQKKKSVTSIYSESDSPSVLLRDMKAGMTEFKANPNS